MASATPHAPGLWRRYLAVPLIWKLTVGLVGGLVTGLAIRAFAGGAGADIPVLGMILTWIGSYGITVLDPLGQIFLNLLQLLVFPLILTTLVAGASSISPQRLGRIGGKVFVLYLITSAFAISVGLGIALAISPGAGLSMPGDAEESAEDVDVADTLLGIFPANPFEALVDGNVLGVMFIALVFGVALAFMLGSNDARIREMGTFLRTGVDAAAELVFRVVRGVLEYAPIGVFALIAVVMAETGVAVLLPLLRLTGVVYGAIVVQILVYTVILLLFRIGVARFFAAAKDPMVTAFVTRSSNGTLPVSMRAAQRMRVNEGVYGFSLPLGATINMDGTAIYVGAATVFIANIAGVTLTPGQLALVVLVGVLASIGTAGVPGAGVIMLTMTVSALGLPLAPVALVAGIDAVLDMARTMCNVTGDLMVTRVVAQTERGMLDDGDTESPAPASPPGPSVGANDPPAD